MPGPYGASLFGEGEDWDYDVDWDSLEPGPDLHYGLDDYIRDQDLEEELEEAINDLLKDYTDAGSQ